MLYRAVENLCSHNMSALIYERLRQECQTHLRGELARLVRGDSTDAASFLVAVDRIWQDHCEQMVWSSLLLCTHDWF